MFKAMERALIRAKIALANKKGEAYVGEAVKILIAVVIGIVLLTGLYFLFTKVVMPELGDTIRGLFNTADNIGGGVTAFNENIVGG